MITLYHNPRCSKSRQSLQLLQNAGIEPTIILYLQQSPSVETLGQILQKLGMKAREFLRKGESVYKELGLDAADLTEAELLQCMHDNPILIERPIAVAGERAVIGRPPENVLTLL